MVKCLNSRKKKILLNLKKINIFNLHLRISLPLINIYKNSYLKDLSLNIKLEIYKHFKKHLIYNKN